MSEDQSCSAIASSGHHMDYHDLDRTTDHLAAIVLGERLPTHCPTLFEDVDEDHNPSHSSASSCSYGGSSSYSTPRTHRQLSSSSIGSIVPSSAQSITSRNNSISTAPSTAPTDHSESPSLNYIISNMVPHKIYPCLFREVLACHVDFDDEDDWYEHSISHYHDEGLPKHAYCIFCDNEYACDDSDDDRCWRPRMSHIAEHFRSGSLLERSRPDFAVLKDLYAKGGISRKDFEFARGYTERPHVDGLIFPSEDLPSEAKADRNQMNEDDIHATFDVARSNGRHMSRTTKLPRSTRKVYVIAKTR